MLSRIKSLWWNIIFDVILRKLNVVININVRNLYKGGLPTDKDKERDVCWDTVLFIGPPGMPKKRLLVIYIFFNNLLFPPRRESGAPVARQCSNVIGRQAFAAVG